MPGAVPQLYFSCPDEGYFGMEFLDESFANWKNLLLARVDGKSPVEHLTSRKQEFIRTFVHQHLPSPPDSLAEMCRIWFTAIVALDFFEANA